MENIIPKVSSSLSKMWTKILNLEKSLFPALKEELRLQELSQKESKLITVLDFAQIEKNITVVSITNTPKDREEIARAFIAKSVYNFITNLPIHNSKKTPYTSKLQRISRIILVTTPKDFHILEGNLNPICVNNFSNV